MSEEQSPPDRQSPQNGADADTRVPSTPSTETEPGNEPKAPEPAQQEPDHQAVGIGVIGGPQTTADQDDPETTAAELSASEAEQDGSR